MFLHVISDEYRSMAMRFIYVDARELIFLELLAQ